MRCARAIVPIVFLAHLVNCSIPCTLVPCFSTLLTKQIFVSVFFPCASPWPFVETLARNMNCLHVMIKNLNPIIEIDRALASRTL